VAARPLWLAIVALAGAVLGPMTTSAEDRKDDVPEAGILLDLDLLKEPEFTKQRDLLRRLPLIERIRVLENLRLLEAQPDAVPVQKGERK
jgi:hypothetical protein